MLWRIGGGASRRLSIPRDTVASIPGHGIDEDQRRLRLRWTGAGDQDGRAVHRDPDQPRDHRQSGRVPPVHRRDRRHRRDQPAAICSDISGGTKNGGFSLYLRPGLHHLDGRDALTLARTRHNTCNPAESDLTRVRRQQQILNAIKGKLLSPGTFFRLPWASWDAPKVLRTDMGGFTLLSLFAAAEIGGSAPVTVLKPTGATTLPDGSSALTVTPGAVHARGHAADERP